MKKIEIDNFFSNKVKKQEFLKKSYQSLSSSYSFIRNATLKNPTSELSLISLSIKKNERDYYSLYNRLNSFLTINKEENRIPVFFTLTNNKHSYFNKIKKDDYTSALDFSKMIHKNNQLLLRDILKSSIRDNGKVIPLFRKDDYSYLKSSELHKNGMFHTHVVMFIKESKVSEFIERFQYLYTKNKEKYSLGRVEFCLDSNNFNHLPKNFSYNKKIKLYTKKNENILKGDFLYFKKLKKDKEKNDYGVVSYVAKYALKGAKDKRSLDYTEKQLKSSMLNSDAFLTTCIYRYTKIRKVSFSRLLFPRFVYDNFQSANNENIYDLYSYKNLYYLDKCDEIVRHYSYDIIESDYDVFYDYSSVPSWERILSSVNFLSENSVSFKKYFKKHHDVDFDLIYDNFMIVNSIKPTLTFLEFVSDFLDVSLFRFDLTCETLKVKKLVKIDIAFDTFYCPTSKFFVFV